MYNLYFLEIYDHHQSVFNCKTFRGWNFHPLTKQIHMKHIFYIISI